MFKSLGCTKIRKDSKWTKTSWDEVMKPTTNNNDSLPIFPYHVYNQADFDNPFINGQSFIYLGISKMSFTFYVFTRVQGSESIKAARKVNIWLHSHYAGLQAKCFQNKSSKIFLGLGH